MKAYEKYDQLVYESPPGEDYLYIEWFLGNTCNYKCSYCSADSNDGSLPWLDISNIEPFLKELPKRYPNKDFILHTFLGGEVSFWKELPSLINKIKNNDNRAYISITTNGSRSSKWWKENANLFNQIEVSAHPEFADKEKITNVINTVSDFAFTNISVSMIAEDWNKSIELASYIKENAKTSDIYLSPLKKRLGHSEMMEYTSEQKETIKVWNRNSNELFNYNEKLWDQNKMKYNQKTFPYRYLMWKNSKTGEEKKISEAYSSIRLNEENKWKDWYCNIGIDCLNIDPNGIIRMAQGCSWDQPTGDIYKVDEVFWPVEPTKCKYEKCLCAADFSAKKYKTKLNI